MEGDRDLQDVLIRLLADAPFRHALTTVDSGAPYGGLAPHQVEALRSGDARRIDRFANFLARQYYLERIVHYHKYSRVLARWTGRAPHALLTMPEFANLMPSIILGSRTTARDIARLVQAYLADARGAPPYASDIVRYENAQLIAESGPRPHQLTPPPRAVLPLVAIVNPDASIIRFAWDLPAILQPLLALGDADDVPPAPPDAEAKDVSLVFVRSPRGRVTVLRWTEGIETLTAFLDGERPLADAFDAANLRPRDGLATANALLEAGVILAA